jgi:SAM-dependent methyltransferase
MSRETTRSARYYDDFATSYDEPRNRGYHALIDRIELDAALRWARGADVLEVGCGTGRILEGLAGAARRAVGVDLSAGMLERARERELSVLRGTATELPLRDESFDLVCSFKVLAHVPDLGRAFAEMSRVLRPGGRLVVDLYNTLSLRALIKRIGGPRRISRRRTEADVFTRWVTPRQARELIPAGLVIEEWRGARVLTPTAVLHDVPLLGELLGRAEERLSRGPLARLAGFLIAVCRKT